MENTTFKISELIKLWKENRLYVDREYQRGIVWNDEQKKKLVDSVLRRFPIPLLILQKDGEKFNIIDGQQRIEAIIGFHENKLSYRNGSWKEFKLLGAKQFPLYSDMEDGYKWMDKGFHNLEQNDKDRFKDYEIQVIILEGYSNNEIRDIFVRLQSGSPLNFQEKMDSLPGDFNHFILETAGKELVQDRNLILSTGNDTDYSGHEFFTHYVQHPSNDRGKIRKLCADSYLLFREFILENTITGISQSKNAAFYINKLDFVADEPINMFFKELLDDLKIENLYYDASKDKLKNWEVIHLILFSSICKLLEFSEWKDKVGEAFIKFRELLSLAKEDEMKEFSDLIKTDASSSSTIIRRMEIFGKSMLGLMYIKDDCIQMNIKESELLVRLGQINRKFDIEEIKALAETKLSLDMYVKYIYNRLFLPSIKNEENEGNPTHRITKIKAYYKDGKIKEFNSPQQAYKDVFPETAESSLNRAGLIFGTKDSIRINDVYWKIVEKLEFTMNSKKYVVKRNDFDGYWEQRYK